MNLIICIIFSLQTSCDNKKNVTEKVVSINNTPPKSESIDTFKVKPPLVVDKKDKDTSINIYLTFDDGPFYTTPGIIRLLEEKNIKTSFFIVGSQVDNSPKYDSIFQSLKNNKFFKIYNHTYSHAITRGRYKSYYENPENVWDDIKKTKNISLQMHM